MFKYRSILTEVALFFATLACAWYWQWQADDLVWALWISSLTIGYMTLVFGPLIWLLHKVPWVEIRKDTSIKD
ncbi:MAG: hypothetical protein KDK51_10590, partial [Deltaproteobacteria bacterium]|nr:hypothetical protein [Deltaproteobacteria bacterium]